MKLVLSCSFCLKMHRLKEYLSKLNIFESTANTGEQETEQERRSNIIATRIYLVVLTIVLVIIALALWSRAETVVIILPHPSKEQFEVLPIDASCSCSRISISYGRIVSLQASFHQVCSSDFVSDRWLNAIYVIPQTTSTCLNDFHSIGTALFQALAGFCRLSESNIAQSIATFSMDRLISPKVLSETVLRTQARAFIEQFLATVPNSFLTQLHLVIELTKSNQLFSGLQKSIYLSYNVGPDIEPYVTPHACIYPSPIEIFCDCFADLDCWDYARIFNVTNPETSGGHTSVPTVLMNIPGIISACMPVNSIRLSTLACFYNQTCLDELITFFPTLEKFMAMTTQETSHFNPNVNIGSIVDRLMVEEWLSNISYGNYYAQCAPISCIYSKVKRHDVVFTLTKLVGLLGGLTIVLGLIIPYVVRFIRQRPQKSEKKPPVPRKLTAV